MRSTGTLFFIAAIMVLLDFYVYQAIKTVTQPLSERMRIYIHVGFWIISVLTVFSLMAFPFVPALQQSKLFRNYVFAILAGLFIAKLIAATIFLVDDIRRTGWWAISKVYKSSGGQILGDGQMVSRSVFLSWIGLGLGSTLFGTMVFGFRNKYKYQVKKMQLSFANLPKAFDGLKLVQISDVHSGSLQDISAVNKGIDLILQQNADIIFFTGDLVNDRATEMEPLKTAFARLKAPLGVYSTLGNHDYGDYVQWPNTAAKQANLEALINLQKEMGWDILMNEHRIIEKEGEKIAVLGIENWGAKGRFPKYGKMEDAIKGTEQIHWDAQVKTSYSDIDMMFSGHTHGMQFGLENPYFKWSPVQWMYKQWAGLYEDGNQKLYVNRGFGFIGYPGRVGIMPEITVIEFTKA